MRHTACMYALFSMFAASTTNERLASEGGHLFLPGALHSDAHVLCPGLTHGQFDVSELHPGSCFDSPLIPRMLMNGSITVTRVLAAAVSGIVAMV